ncbi:protein ALP1-like isoform X2 [Anneissia japonica]|uniref:protein ALP1-like isoform X1 n=1 Tax=Anneissia japonica TaxID=1529436 RepID=UPI001425B4AF|nr:protein ALP1-like isoform X1 [Anneissia japonica]XP_033120864.1 protein ALP1-like isoform X2 [Anneissia japonica]
MAEVSYLSHLGLRGKTVRRRLWRKKRSRDWWVNVVPSYTDSDFIEDFRLNKDTFKYFVNEIKPAIEKKQCNNGLTFCTEWRVAMTLYRLSSGMSFKKTGNQFGCAKSTACIVYHQVCKAIEALLMPKFIQFPTGQDISKNIEKFKLKNGFPQTVVAIDGTHIPIIAPEEEPNDYFNRHDVHSIILQGVVDAEGMFIDTFCGMPGSVNDARVFQVSQFSLALREDRLFQPCPTEIIKGVEIPPLILGDGAYPMLANLMRPFAGRNSLPREKTKFNQKLSGCRVVVEQAFGRLKGRCRILLKRNEHQLQNLRHVVQACCTLHNICQTNGVPYRKKWNEKVDGKKKKKQGFRQNN